MTYQKELEFAKELAYEAGKLMRRYFRAEDIGTTLKKDNTPLTVADTKINKLVIEKVKAAFPEDGVLGEEESFEPKRDRIWVVDPIDGTVPFSLGIPLSTFLLALVNKSDGQPAVAVVYEPYLDHLYTAVKGGGAFLNDARLKTSDSTNFIRDYGTLYGPPVKTNTIEYLPGNMLEKLRAQGTNIINISSGGYTAVKVASGEFAFVMMGNGAPWDVAAPSLVITEAGGVVTDLEGKQRRFDEFAQGCVLASHQSVLDMLLKMIKV